MRTDKQIEASRINGQKSLGPITEEGKATSSLNAVRHGLLSNTLVLPGESEERFLQLLAELLEEHCPSNRTQLKLVENLAVAEWRRSRLLGVETAGIAEEIYTQESSPGIAEKPASARASIAMRRIHDTSGFLDLMNRYDARLGRECNSIEKRLDILKKR